MITEYLHRTHKRVLAAQQDRRADELVRIDGGYGLDDARVLEASINGARHVSVRHGERLRLRFVVRRRADIAHPGLIFDVLDGRGLQLTGRRVVLPAGAEDVTVDVGFDASFQQGIYRLRMRVVDSPSIEQTVVLSRQEGWLSFEVVDDSRELFTGLFPVPMEIGITP